MKKVLVLVAVVISASFASCKKDYACKCTTTINGMSTTQTGATFKAKKKDAKDGCSAANSYTTCEAVEM